MAPEEHSMGSTIDQRTTVYTLGRLALHLGTSTTDDPSRYVGGPSRAAVLVQATAPDPADRYLDVAALALHTPQRPDLSAYNWRGRSPLAGKVQCSAWFAMRRAALGSNRVIGCRLLSPRPFQHPS